MTNVTPIGQLFNLPQLTADAARALALRVGEEMTATILDMAGNQALINTDKGARLLATVQSDEPLHTGQSVVLQVVDSTPDQLTLRLASPSGASGEPLEPARLLRSIGLSDTAANRQAVEALMAEGQPVNKQTVQELRTALAALQLSQPDDFRAVAYLMARGLPVTSALVEVVRQGLSGASLVALADELRQEASSLLDRLPENERDDPAVAQLRTALQNLVSSSQSDLRNPAALRQTIADLADSLEAALARAAVEEQLGGTDAQAADASSAGTDAPPLPDAESHPAQAAVIAQEPESSTSAQQGSAARTTVPTSASESETSSPSVILSEAKNLPSSARAQDSSSPTAPQNDMRAGAGGAIQDTDETAASLSRPGQTIQSLPLSAGAQARVDSEPSLPAPTLTASQSDTHLAVRQLLPALENAIASGSLPDAVRDGAAALRDRSEAFVNNVQFQQIQNALPASSGGPDYLSFPLPLWAGQQASQGELRLYIHDQTGSRRIDPEDVRIVMKLHMTRLQHLTVSVHVLGRNIMCHIDSENPAVDRLVRVAAPELQLQLQRLGYNVAPITCSNLGDGLLSGQQRSSTHRLSSVNVRA